MRIPSVEKEDLRRSHRERERLIGERTAHVNRIKGLLFAQGIRDINVKAKYKTLDLGKLVTGDGRPLPTRLANEIAREIERPDLLPTAGEFGAFWNEALLEVAPKSNCKLPRNCHDHYTFDAPALSLRSLQKPSGDRALGLMLDPQP